MLENIIIMILSLTYAKKIYIIKNIGYILYPIFF